VNKQNLKDFLSFLREYLKIDVDAVKILIGEDGTVYIPKEETKLTPEVAVWCEVKSVLVEEESKEELNFTPYLALSPKRGTLIEKRWKELWNSLKGGTNERKSTSQYV